MKNKLKNALLRILYGTIEPIGQDVSQPMSCTVIMPDNRAKLNIGSLYENLPQL
jgi:hypothetical protein